jgi:hypothetical protein
VGDAGDARAPYAPRVSYAPGAAAYGGAPRGRRRSAAGCKPSAFRRLADRGARK